MHKIGFWSFLLLFSSLTHAYDYQVKPGVFGTINSVGSDTMAGLISGWSQEFKRIYPHVKIQIQASGSATAPPALTEGMANIGPMSRELKISEIDYFARRHGYPPTVIAVAMDAIVLFVSPDNPINGLHQKEIDSIYSATRYCGGANPVTNWNQAREAPDSYKNRIRLFGRNAASGTYGLFKQVALCNGDFRADVNELPSSASIVQTVANNPEALGYAAYGYVNSSVKLVPISSGTGDELVEVSPINISNGNYPFSRTLYLIANIHPSHPLDNLTKEFLLFIMSRQGQSLVANEGYVGISERLIQRQLRKIVVSDL